MTISAQTLGPRCVTVLSLAWLLSTGGCTEPAHNAPGVEEQPTFTPERSPATVPTRTPDPLTADNQPFPGVDDRDSLGTTSTPASVLPAAATAEPAPPAKRASARFEPAKGSRLAGKVTLAEADDGVHLKVDVEDEVKGLARLEVRERGDCRALAAKGTVSGGPSQADYLGNIRVDDEGKGTLEVLLPSATLGEDDPQSLVGHALVIEALDELHAKKGKSGRPLACALIRDDGVQPAN